MKTLTCFVSLALAASASAQFSVTSNVGGAIPGAGTGDGTGWDVAAPDLAAHRATGAVASETLTLPAVTSIQSITIHDMTHTWAGDTMGVLWQPGMTVGHTVWVRPGHAGASGFGNSGDWVGTTEFVDGGNPLDVSGNMVNSPYSASDGDTLGGHVWPSGASGVTNGDLANISGPAGDWVLEIHDFAGGDSGAFTGVTIEGNGGGAVCGANSANSVGSGAVLSGTSGNFVVTGVPNQPGIGYYGMTATQQPFGCGERCIGGTVVRLAPVFASGNTATITDAVPSGSLMQFWGRDPVGCPSNGGFNLSNVITVP